MNGHSEGELWGLAVHPKSLDFVTASCDKTIRSWSFQNKVCIMYMYTTMLLMTSLSLLLFPPSPQALLHYLRVDHQAASADISADGTLVVIGLHNGEFLILGFQDFNIIAQKRDRSKTLQAVRYSRRERGEKEERGKEGERER